MEIASPRGGTSPGDRAVWLNVSKKVRSQQMSADAKREADEEQSMQMLLKLREYRLDVESLGIAANRWRKLEEASSGTGSQQSGSAQLIQAAEYTLYSKLQESLDALLSAALPKHAAGPAQLRELAEAIGSRILNAPSVQTCEAVGLTRYPDPDQILNSFPRLLGAGPENWSVVDSMRSDLVSSEAEWISQDHSSVTELSAHPSRLDDIDRTQLQLQSLIEVITDNHGPGSDQRTSAGRMTSGKLLSDVLDLVTTHSELVNLWRLHIHGAAIRLGDSQIRRKTIQRELAEADRARMEEGEEARLASVALGEGFEATSEPANGDLGVSATLQSRSGGEAESSKEKPSKWGRLKRFGRRTA